MDDHGRSWLIPVLRGQQSQYGFLPVDYDWSESFTPKNVLRAEFEDLWNQSAKIWDHLYVEGFNVPESELAAFVARCFAVNYRIGPRELEALRRIKLPPIDRSSLNEWASLTVDYPAVIEYAAKKKMTVVQAAHDGICFLAGDPAGTMDLSRAGGSSE